MDHYEKNAPKKVTIEERDGRPVAVEYEREPGGPWREQAVHHSGESLIMNDRADDLTALVGDLFGQVEALRTARKYPGQSRLILSMIANTADELARLARQ